MVSKGVQSVVEKVCNVVTRVHKAGVASIKKVRNFGKLGWNPTWRLVWT